MPKLVECLFCRTRGPRSKEHVIPEWLQGELGFGPEQLDNVHLSPEGEKVTARPHARHGVYTLVKNAQVGNMWWDVAFWTGKGGKSGAAARAAGLTGMGVITGAHEVAPSQVLEIEHRA